MNRKFLRSVFNSLLMTTTLAGFASTSFASAEEDEDYMSYDAILSDLKREAQPAATSKARKPSRPSDSSDPFENVWIHTGVALTGATQSLAIPSGDKKSFNQQGIQFTVGIDLFSENLMAEGSARSFGEVESGNARMSLKEFELKVFYKEKIARRIGLRAGAGLAARYLTLTAGETTKEYTTPSSVGTLGLDLFMTDRFSVGADLNARNTLVADTIDRNSFDAALRFDVHF